MNTHQILMFWFKTLFIYCHQRNFKTKAWSTHLALNGNYEMSHNITAKQVANWWKWHWLVFCVWLMLCGLNYSCLLFFPTTICPNKSWYLIEFPIYTDRIKKILKCNKPIRNCSCACLLHTAANAICLSPVTVWMPERRYALSAETDTRSCDSE